MTTLAAAPTRAVTQEEIDAYQRDGAVLLRGIIPIAWVRTAADAIEEIRATPGTGEFYGDQQQFFLSNMNGVWHEKVRSYIMDSPVAGVAGTVHGASQLHYFLDQIFYKAAGDVTPTEWHQDTPYFNVTGRDIVRAWLPLDPAPRQITVEVVCGSHLWDVTYRTGVVEDGVAHRPAEGFSILDLQSDENAPAVPDIDANRDAYRIVGWDVEPGDLLVFHGHVIHGAGGAYNHPLTRRALALVLAGATERVVRRPGNAIPDIAAVKSASIEPGELLSDHSDVYPIVWTAPKSGGR